MARPAGAGHDLETYPAPEKSMQKLIRLVLAAQLFATLWMVHDIWRLLKVDSVDDDDDDDGGGEWPQPSPPPGPSYYQYPKDYSYPTEYWFTSNEPVDMLS